MASILYEGNVSIDPVRKNLKARLEVFYPQVKVHVKTLEFGIYNTEVLSVSGEYVDSVKILKNEELSPFLLGHSKIIIQLKDIEHIKDLEIHFNYEINFQSYPKEGMNAFTERYIELGLYTPWYPLDLNFPEVLYQIQMEVPEGYRVLGAKRDLNQNWLLAEMKNPHADIAFIVAKKCVEEKSYLGPIVVDYFRDSEEDVAKMLQEKVQKSFEFFSQHFGESGKDNFHIALVPRDNTETSGGYCRPRLITIPIGENRHNNGRYSENQASYLLEYMLHEMGHLWWSKADCFSREDWLNESFAEYSKYIALAYLEGESYYEEKMENLRIRAEQMPVPWQKNLDIQERFEPMRVKGPYELYQIEKQIGRGNLLKILKEIHLEKAATTQAVFDIINKRGNIELKDR